MQWHIWLYLHCVRLPVNSVAIFLCTSFCPSPKSAIIQSISHFLLHAVDVKLTHLPQYNCLLLSDTSTLFKMYQAIGKPPADIIVEHFFFSYKSRFSQWVSHYNINFVRSNNNPTGEIQIQVKWSNPWPLVQFSLSQL